MSFPSQASNTQRHDDGSHLFVVKFWGVRGSIPTPGANTVRYGGNTACVEVLVAGKRLIFDGGTGLRILGKNLLKDLPVEGHLFFTHTHWDRIQGFPFFIPAFIEKNCFHIYGATGLNGASIKQRLTDQMLRPNFPVPLQMMKAEMHFHNIAPGSIIHIDDVVVETISLSRSSGALGYRVSCNGYSVVYATDTEHQPTALNEGLLYLAHQADLLIFDTVYADHAYYDPKASELARDPQTWKASLDATIGTTAKQIVMFHHAPGHEDDFLEAMEAELQAIYPNVQMAREAMVLTLG
ncbi:MAG: MBL fold metallo-hydrolase [Synechococcales bacterium]|nr:MBL fold metallo-hydrolase [Synechococcales bacterium]